MVICYSSNSKLAHSQSKGRVETTSENISNTCNYNKFKFTGKNCMIAVENFVSSKIPRTKTVISLD